MLEDEKVIHGEGALWRAMQDLHNQGLSTLWCRMEEEVYNGKIRKAKTPIGQWKSAMKTRFSLDHLAKTMHTANVKLGIAVVCGEISGNLEVIDIDVKHWPGIDALYLQEVKDIFPALFDRLRIGQSASGGKHIAYRCEEPIGEGGQKLACQIDPETKKAKEAGIETRGEGSLCTWAPSPGYTIIQDRPIPTISRAERDALIILARLFDQRVKKEYAPTQKSHESVYDENPFQHFNSSSEAEQILLKYGWTVMENSKQFIYFSHPDKKTRGNSATFLKDKRLYRIWTTSTGLEPQTNYSPANILCQLEFGGDWKLTYRYLVDHGFGKVKPEYEKKAIPKMAATKTPIPPNFSQAAKDAYHQRISDFDKTFPHGIFWELNDEDEYTIRRPLMITVCTGLGLAVYNGNPIFVEKPFFKKLRSEREAYDIVKDYIKEEDADTYMRIMHAFDKFWEHSGKYILSRLPVIEKKQILRSTFQTAYKVFGGNLVSIDADKIVVGAIPSESDKLIDKEGVIDDEFVEDPDYQECKFVDFLNKAVVPKGEDRDKVLGYLCYDYKDQTEGKIIGFLEEIEARLGGGSGKGVTCQCLGLWTAVKTVDGDMIHKKDVLLQSWNDERILHLNDLPKRFNIATLKALATEGTERKVLYKNIETVSPEDMPKLILSGQFGLNTFDDGGIGRRIEILPFTNYFNKDHTPIMEYGGKIPDVWTRKDWNGFYTYIVKAIQLYMKDRRLRLSDKMKDASWDKNFDYAYSMGGEELREWIGDRVKEVWVKMEHVTNEEMQQQYDQFCREQNIKNDMRIRRLHEAIGAWCDRHGYKYEYGKVIREGDKTKRVIVVKEKGREEEPGYPTLWDEVDNGKGVVVTEEKDVIEDVAKVQVPDVKEVEEEDGGDIFDEM